MIADRLGTLLSVYLAGRRRPDAPSPEELCRDCPELLAELRRRISAADFADALLKSTGDAAGPGTGEYTTPTFPERLGEYQVRGVLGRGGMGAVLLADDPRLGRRVAIKVMLAQRAADTTARERFVREARAAAAVRHDHVVPIFHVGEQDRVPYLVMPLLEGESLEARLRRGPIPPDEVVRIGREAALGLSAAHAKGLVHRDVKPANLWLEAPAGRVLVLDFGLVRSVDASDGVTRAGTVLGTAAYMAPEQADGLAVDARTDLFALGATLYEAATGVCPFARPTLTATLKAVADHQPQPPHDVNPVVPPASSGTIMRLLAKRPDDRPRRPSRSPTSSLHFRVQWQARSSSPRRRNRGGGWSCCGAGCCCCC